MSSGDSDSSLSRALSSLFEDSPVVVEPKNELMKVKKSEPESLSQYTIFGGAYLPTSATVQTLPAGVYKPAFLNDRFVFQPLDLFGDSLMEFPDSKSDFVVAEVEQFWDLRSKFKELGFSHKRGILLYGPPGGGKSSLVIIILKKMVERGGLVLIADHPHLLATALQQLRQIEPDRQAVVIWEDLDSVIKHYGEPEVLSVLDGESQVENILFLATTNYPEELEKRITNRPSRFDRLELIDMPSDAARAMYLNNKVGTVEREGLDLVKLTKGFSIAHLRELIVSVWCLGRGVQETVDRLRGMAKTPKSEGGNSVGFGG